MAREVSREGSSLSPQQAAAALVPGYRAELGHSPPRELAELMLAQHWVETAQGRTMHGNNWGNLSAGSSWQGDFWRPTWWEVGPESSERDQRLHALMREGKVPSKFRAYPTIEAGVRDYVRLLQKPRFVPMMATGKRGDVDAFARAIQQTGYCPDCEPVSTAKTLRALRAKVRKLGLFKDLPSSARSSAGAGVAGGLLGLWLLTEALGTM